MPRHRAPTTRVALELASAAPIAARWVERLLAEEEPRLTLAQYETLRGIAERSLVAAELAERAAVSAAAVSQLVAALEGAGLVERTREPGDRRIDVLSLTTTGRRVLAAVDRRIADRLGGLLSQLPPPELDALGRALGPLESVLTGVAPPRRRPPPRPPARRPGHPR